MSLYIKHTIGIWMILFVTILPFPYFIISPIFDVRSDAVLLYWFSLALFPIALLIGALFLLLTLEVRRKIETFLFIGITYILAFFLLKYGLDKLLLLQFYPPEPNTLFTPLGDLSKDLLFWSSMGTSKLYNIFMGLIEIIPGTLLLFRKTRLFGSLCAFGLLLNIFMINIGFDISVKLLSLYLLVCSIYLILPFLTILFKLFFKEEDVKQIRTPRLFSTESFTKRALKTTVLVLFIFDLTLPYLNNATIEVNSNKETMVGSYNNLAEGPPFLKHNVKRIHVHSKGYFIIEDTDGNFIDYRCSISADNERIRLTYFGKIINVGFKKDRILFSWLNENRLQTLITKKINLKKLPVNNDSFHWTVEGIVEK